MARKSDKRNRLVDAASTIFLLKGIGETTLANIAVLADVPLGNVYYYFKTKNELVSDVIKLKHKLLQETLVKIEGEQTTPELQLKVFIQQFLNLENEEQNLGATITMLCVELSKGEKQLFDEFLSLPENIIEWCTKRFEALSKGEQSKKLAVGLLALLQGICTMRHAPDAKQMLPLQTNFIEQAIGIAS